MRVKASAEPIEDPDKADIREGNFHTHASMKVMDHIIDRIWLASH